MGKLNNSAHIFDTITNIKQDMNYSDYSKHLETRPILSTWYNQNLVASTAESGLQTVNQFVGKNSPVHYNKIEKVPLYSVPLTNLGLDFDDKGPHIDFDVEGVLPPGIFEPKPNDFVVINYLGNEFLFKVKTVDFDTIRSNNYYKVTMYFSKNNNGQIEDCVTENSTVIYDDIGSKTNKCIMLNTDYEECNELISFASEITDLLVQRFWEGKYCFFIYNQNVYDPWLNFFIKKVKLLQNEEYDNIITIQDPIVVDQRNFLNYYNISYFNALESKNVDILKNNKYVLLQDVTKIIGNPFSMYNMGPFGPQIKEVKHIKVDSKLEEELKILEFNNFDKAANFDINYYIDKDFIESIITATIYDNPNPIEALRNTIITSFYNNNKEHCTMLKDKFNEYKYSSDFNASFTTFITLFSFLYVVKEKINSLRKK